MAGSFQVGSITAKLVLDDSTIGQRAKSILSKTKALAGDIRRALSPATSADFVRERPVLASIRRVSQGVRRLARTVRTTLGRAFRTAFRLPVTATVASLRRIGQAARRAGSQITTVFGRGLTRSLQTLRRTIFGLQGALAAVGVSLGAIGAVSRAREVESLRTAFESLTGAVGENADAFIKDLRTATRGAVSDLELFRVTNNAALLGVVQSKDQYVELASLARRLGRAVGRDAVDALNDLSIGIGRQSRLILDNLGIIVRVEEANEKYARQLGKTVNELSQFERRQAFLNATIDAAREKVNTLGPDVLTLQDAWGRFTAQISNTATIISEAFVGPGPFNAIATWLEDQQRNIRRFAILFSDVFKALIRGVGQVLGSIFSASSAREFGTRISRIISDVFRIINRLIIRLIQNLFGELGALIAGLTFGLLASLGNALIAELGPFFVRLGKKIQAEITRVYAKIPGLNSLLGLDDPDIAEDVAKSFEREGDRSAKAIREFTEDNQKQIDRFVGKAFDAVADRTGEAVIEVTGDLKEIAEESKIQGGIIGEALGGAFEGVESALKAFRESGDAGQGLRDLSEQSQLAQRAAAALAEQFEQTLAPFRTRAQALRLEIQTIGFEDSEKELIKFDDALKSFRDTIESPEDIVSRNTLARINELRDKLAELLEQRDAAKNLEATLKKIEAFEDQILQLQDTIAEIEIGDLAVKFDKLGRALDEALTDAPAEKAQEIRDAFEEMAQALAVTEIAKVSAEIRNLEESLGGIDDTEAAAKIRELERGFDQFRLALSRANIDTKTATVLLSDMREKVTELQEKTAFADLDRTIRDLKLSLADSRRELDLIGASDLDRKIADIKFEYDGFIKEAVRATEVLILNAKAAGANADEIKRLQDRLADFRAEAAGLRDREITTARQAESDERALARIESFGQAFDRGLTDAVFSALKKGEGAAKIFAEALASFTDQAIRDAVSGLTEFLQNKLKTLFGSLGAGGAVAGIATGLLGIGGAILQNLENDTTSQVDDFDSAVNSSEAVRGVVAGPTNVAVAKIGDSLKQAMRTTELLLEQILQTLQGGALGGGPGPGGFSANDSLSLSTSTPT